MNRLIQFLVNQRGAQYETWLKNRTAGAVFPDDVEELRDIPYLPDGQAAHRMDVYRPKERQGKLPVILNLHGGGLVLCSKDVNRLFCAQLARRGYLVFCIDYPLVPQATVPQILGDVCRGLEEAGRQLEGLGGDRSRVYLTGDSAGAFLAVYALAAQRDGAIAQAAGIRPADLDIQGLGLISGMFHTAQADETGLFLRSSFYGKQWRSHPLLPYLKPELPQVAGLMCPVFLVTGKSDKLRPSTLRFYRGLRQAGIRCRLLDFPAGKGLGHDFAVTNPQLAQSQQAMDEMVHFWQENQGISREMV